MKIGTIHKGYPAIRNIINLPYQNIKVVKVIDVFKIYTHIYYKLFNKSHQLSLNFFYDAGLNSVDINHFFNGISLSNTTWITTFETSLPRFGNVSHFWYRLGIKRLAHKSCKKIIAFSNCTYTIQKTYLLQNYPEYYKAIIDKVIVIHPSQQLLVDDKKITKKDSTIVFTIVGADFFRKGGLEILKVFDRLSKLSIGNWKLNIISTLQYGDYASQTTQKDYNEALGLIYAYDKIKYHKYLPNKDVLEIFKNTDVALLPTYADTYGYSVLEAQAAGCPVITTDIRALTEINNDKCGWVIKVPKDEHGNGVLGTEEDRKKFSHLIEEQLYKIIKDEILTDREIIREKGELALARIKNEHDPDIVALQLEAIYKEAVGEV